MRDVWRYGFEQGGRVMETDRHGYCEHNRRDHKCWECQAQRARAAELRVAELEGERDTVVELASRLEVDIESLNQTDTELTAKVAELQAQLDRANALNAKVAAIWRASYGNATALHIAMIGVFPGEGES
jgi:hypothetical protein